MAYIRCINMTIPNDPKKLDPGATPEQLLRFGQNLCKRAYRKFGVPAWVHYWPVTQISADRPEVQKWLMELMTGDEWRDLLVEDPSV